MPISRTRKKSYKKRFIISIITLLLTVSCFVFTSYAWFTNSAYVSGNKVFAGNLMVDVLISEEDLEANLVKTGAIEDGGNIPDTLNSFKYVRELDNDDTETYYYASRIPSKVNEKDIDTSILHVENVEPGQAIRVKVNVVNSGDLALKAAGALRVDESLTGIKTFLVKYPEIATTLNDAIEDPTTPTGKASTTKELYFLNTLLSMQATNWEKHDGADINIDNQYYFKDNGGHLEDVLCVYLLEDVGDGDLNFDRETLNNEDKENKLQDDPRFFGTLKQFEYMITYGANPTDENISVYNSFFNGAIELNAHGDYKSRLESDYLRYLDYASGYCLPLGEMQDSNNKILKDGRNVEVFDADGKSLYTRMGVSEIDTINFLLYMPLEAGDEYQNASISLSLGATASQVEYEKDDFDYMIYDMSAQNTSHTTPLTPPSRGDLIKIDGKKYRVLDINENKEAKLLAMYDASSMTFYESEEPVEDTITFIEEEDVSGIKYADSDIDKYLNETFYESLSFKNAIVPQEINQNMYKRNEGSAGVSPDANPWYKAWFVSTTAETDTGAIKYTVTKIASVSVGSRSVYLLDVEDVISYLDQNFSPQQLNTMFWDTDSYYEGSSPDRYIYLRSADKDGNNRVWHVFGVTGGLGVELSSGDYGIRPAFVVDLTQVEYAKVID